MIKLTKSDGLPVYVPENVLINYKVPFLPPGF